MPLVNRYNGRSFWDGPMPLVPNIERTTPQDKYAQYNYERGRYDFKHFAEFVFPHHCGFEFSEMHEAFFENEKNPEKKGLNEATAAPRGNAKTTFKVLLKPLHIILYGYGKFLVVIGNSKTDGIEKTNAIRQELLGNETLLEIYGPQLSNMAGQGDFVTYNGTRVLAKGSGQSIRGIKHGQHRPDWVFFDDVETLEGTRTPERRAKTKHWFMSDVMGAGAVDGTTNFIFVGTVLHELSLLADLLKTPGWDGTKYKALKQPPKNLELWSQYRNIYCDLDNPNAITDAEAFYQINRECMDEGAEVLWPAGEPYKNLVQYIIKYGLASFNSEKQNDPFDPEAQILNPDLCPRFKVLWPGDDEWLDHFTDINSAIFGKRTEGFLIVSFDGKTVKHSSELREIIGFHDPALAHQTKSDYAAIAIVAQDFNDRLYLLEMYLKKQGIDQQLHNAFTLCQKWGVSKLYLETNNFQSLLKSDYKEFKASFYKESTFKVIGVDQHTNKIARIGTLQPYFDNGWIWFNQQLPQDFIDQCRQFPTSDHDDGPDALDSAKRQLRAIRGVVYQVR